MLFLLNNYISPIRQSNPHEFNSNYNYMMSSTINDGYEEEKCCLSNPLPRTKDVIEEKKFNPNFEVSSIAIETVEEILSNFKNNIFRYVILFAQMQSGKTNTFLLLAGMALYYELVDDVIIFTGNRSIDLKKQLNKDRDNFFMKSGKFENYLRTINNDLSERQVRDIRTSIYHRIKIIWGTELLNNIRTIPNEKTLYIYEESHYAQTIGQVPEKFLNKIGISMDGSTTKLEENNSFVCSISATPFSEMIDRVDLKQKKYLVKMKPDKNYRGIKWLYDNNKIIGFNNWKKAFEEVLKTRNHELKWNFIRVRESKDDNCSEYIKDLCEKYNCDCINYDQKNKIKNDDDDDNDEDDLAFLKFPPTRPTIVILKELCRMGTVFKYKDYISTLFETTIKPASDTILQGFIGRMCGYHLNDDIQIYVSNYVLKEDYIQKYIELCNEGDRPDMPAKNVVHKSGVHNTKHKKKQTEYIIPIIIPKDFITVEIKSANKVPISNDIEIFIHSDNFKFINIDYPDSHLEGVKKFFKKDKTTFRQTNKKSYKNIPYKLNQSITNKTSPHLGSAGGTQRNDKNEEGSAIIYHINDNESKKQLINMHNNLYLCLEIEIEDDDSKEIKKLFKTTGKEIFYGNKSENGEIIIGNGSQPVLLQTDTSINEELMLNSIRQAISRSREEGPLITLTKIVSNYSSDIHGYKGIYVSNKIFESLKNGRIYNIIKDEFDIKLKLCKMRGRINSKLPLPDGCNLRLSEISW